MRVKLVCRRGSELREMHGLVLVLQILVHGNNNIVQKGSFEYDRGLSFQVARVKLEGQDNRSLRDSHLHIGACRDFCAARVRNRLPGIPVHQFPGKGVCISRFQIAVVDHVPDCYLSSGKQILSVIRSAGGCTDFREEDALVLIVYVLMDGNDAVFIGHLLKSYHRYPFQRAGIECEGHSHRAVFRFRDKYRLSADFVALRVQNRGFSGLVDKHAGCRVFSARSQVPVFNYIRENQILYGIYHMLPGLACQNRSDFRERDCLVLIGEIRVVCNYPAFHG